jgi:unsaturated chondroitin disaccharide hydrolase
MERYRDVAVSHTDPHFDWYIRSNGSRWHHTEFDPGMGELIRQYNELAYSNDTCWGRGQGWCIAGLARAYRETEAGCYLKALRDFVNYYVEHTPADLVLHWDLEHPEAPNAERDTSAAALAAYGPTRLLETRETEQLVDIGERILQSLVAGYLTPLADDERSPGMVLES